MLSSRTTNFAGAPEIKLLRDLFTERNNEAERVVLDTRPHRRNLDERVWGWFPGDYDLDYCYEADTQRRDFENIAANDVDTSTREQNVARHFVEQVEQHKPEAWVERKSLRRAYEINFNRYFYKYTPPRPLAEIDADLKQMEEELLRLLREVVG